MSRYGYHYRASSSVTDGPRDVMDSPWVLAALTVAALAIGAMAVAGWLV